MRHGTRLGAAVTALVVSISGCSSSTEGEAEFTITGIVQNNTGAAMTAGPSWVADFPAGYSVGVGVDGGSGFDEFAPAGATDVVLTIDDIANIEFVNWT